MAALRQSLFLFFIAGLNFIVLPQAYAQEVVAMQVSHATDKVSVYVGVSKNVEYKAFALHNPTRIVLDLERGSLAMGLPSEQEMIQASHGLIANVRSGQNNKQTYRLVFELNEDVRLSSHLVAPSKDSVMPRIRLDMQLLNAPRVGSKPVIFKKAETKNTTPKLSQVNKKDTNTNTNEGYQFNIGKEIVIAIDAGHGGKDPGAIGKRKTQEKEVVLQVAKKLADRINKHPRMKAVLTRSGDYFVGLGTRTKIAREAGADLFISIHADAVERRSAKGSSVYVLSNKRASSELAKILAHNENESYADGALIGRDKDLRLVLLDMSKDFVLHESTLMAKDILASLTQIGNVHSRKVERASFAVLKSLDIPSILVETAFISNPEEEAKLKTKAYQDKLSLAIYNGLVNYASNQNLFEQVATRNK